MDDFVTSEENDALMGLLNQTDNEAALSVLHHVFDAMEHGVSLWDKNFKLVLCNDKYMEIVAPFRDTPFEVGMSGEQVVAEAYRSGIYADAEDFEEAEFIELWMMWARSHAGPRDVAFTNGRIAEMSAKQTDLGGVLITAIDVTEKIRAERLFFDVIERLPVGVAIEDKDGKIKHCNEAFARFYNLPPEAIKAQSQTEHRSALADQFEEINSISVEGKPFEELAVYFKDFTENFVSYECKLKDGRYFFAERAVSKDGDTILVFTDITSRKTEQEDRFSSINDAIEGTGEGLVLFDKDAKFVLGNKAYYDLLWTEIEAPYVGETVESLFQRLIDNDYYAIPEGMSKQELFDAGLDVFYNHGKNLRMDTASGRMVIASSHQTGLDGYLISFRDITEEQNAEEKARAMLYDSIELLEEGFSLWDADFKLVMCNDRYMQMVAPFRETPFEVGLPGEDAIAMSYRAGLYELAEGKNEQEFIDLFMTWARSHAGPLETKLTNGRTLVVSSKKTKLGGVLITTLDVTEERNTEEKARAMLYDAVESLEEGFALFDSDMKFLRCNQKYIDDIIPFKGEPFPVGTSIGDILREIFRSGTVILPEDLTEDDVVADIENWVEEFGEKREYHFKDGRIVSIVNKPTKLGGFLVTSLDITEERNSEEKARGLLLDAFQALGAGFALYDAEAKFIFGNERFFDMWHGELSASPAVEGELMIDQLTRIVDADYVIIPEGSTKEDARDFLWNEASNFAQNIPVETKGGAFLCFSHRTKLGGFLLEFIDITEQKTMEAELAQQRETAHQNEKLSALGELLAGVAHELNNPLSVVFGYAQMLQGKVDDPTISKRIDMIGQSAERAAKIVKTFLAMARQRPTKIEVCSLNEIIGTALEVSTYALTANGTKFIIKLDETIPNISGDFDQLAQVFTNLIVNAGHALEPQRDNGILTIRSFYDQKTDHSIVEIKDNGPGIPKDIQNRIFEPFFTTKEVGKGTGVGLAFSHRIVDSHGGLLKLNSDIGKGASFFVKLRSAKPTNEQAKIEEVQPDRVTGKRILVIDDEVAVAELVTDILNECGFTVTTQTNPKEALRLLEKAEYDAIISDFKMPLMNGEQFYNSAKVIAPEAASRIGFMTGDAMSDNVKPFFASSKRPHIEKPINAEELIALIQKLTDAA